MMVTQPGMIRILSKAAVLALFSLAAISCKRDRYSPSQYLSETEQQQLVRQMVYYCTKLPPNASESDKFNPGYNWYYDRAAAEAGLLKFYTNEKHDFNYFFLTRTARSITPMKEGIAGKVKLNSDGSLADYEEVFRTWKMHEDTLAIRGAMLFDRMVTERDLSLFYSQFQGDRYIEFPSERYKYDNTTKRWVSVE
jgi:hypothetical protein